MDQSGATFINNVSGEFAATLTRVVYEMDMKAVAVQAAQADLIREMDRLAQELSALLAAADDPPPIDPVVVRLLACRKRLLAANNTLTVSKDRLARIRALLVK
ncbi:hypothetical protein CcCBS67573_g06413 [Chytriomyces confervae]|uniref:Biogenesis of lysosome-related organelles complex 1 subunit 7 n=1 Tax=Chytriomyces confervae TaxID=246404 RepID=A0A507F5X1_9FUNG|nr:hypothetical protein HDU80_005868 [Chytriomyces hyalinus]TPX70778.1 hypothetical protein CcCBS67573_g06413 [Chytriomyces confervae]